MEGLIEQKDTIKLMKMSKGYQWEIKVGIENEQDIATLERISAIDTKLREKYGETGEVLPERK